MHEEYLPGGILLRGAPGVFPLGQDSVLLADFAACPPRGRALDLGCGAGVLSLLLLGKHPALCVTALERSETALVAARDNRARNALETRLSILAGDVREIRTLIPHGAFDFVICNPPYFASDSGKAHASLATARQLDGDISDFVRAAAFALRHGGKAAFVYRPERLMGLCAAMHEAKLEPKRLRFVHQHAGSVPSAVFIEAQKGAREGLSVLPPLLIKVASGAHSDEYKKIYHLL